MNNQFFPSLWARVVSARIEDLFFWRSWMSLAAHIAGLFVLFWLLRKATVITQINDLTVYSHSITLDFVRQNLPGALALTIALLVLWGWGRLGAKWSDLGNEVPPMRLAVLLLASVAVWTLGLYPYNYYFDQWHYLDRGLLLLLFGLLCWRPGFILPFLLVAFCMLWQFGLPDLGAPVFPHKLQVLYPLLLFAAVMLVYAVTGIWSPAAFLLVLCAMVAATYWVSGLAKLTMAGGAWMLNNELHLVISAAYTHGWLSALTPEQIAQVANLVAPLDVPLQIFVVVVELACVIIVLTRKFAQWLLLALAAFHIGVFFYMGFLFWTWITVNSVVLYLVRAIALPKPLWLRLTLTIPLILIGARWANTPSLSWFDTRLSYSYEVVGTDVRGQTMSLAPNYFGPYADAFTMQSFAHLSQSTNLTSPYGITSDFALVKRLDTPMSQQGLNELEAERQMPQNERQMALTSMFEQFVQRYVSHRNCTKTQAHVLSLVSAPRQFHGELTGARDDADEPIASVAVLEHVSYFTVEGPKLVRTHKVSNVEIDPHGCSR